MAAILATNDGTLVVDLGHNDKFTDEAAHPWNSLSTVLTYHRIRVCNLGVTNQGGVPLSRAMHIMVLKHRQLVSGHASDVRP